MTIYEVLSVISIALTTILALSSIIVPFITTYLTNKMKLKSQEIELFHNAIDGIMSAYGEYRTNTSYKLHLLSAIYKTMTFCSVETKAKLQSLADTVNDQKSYAETDNAFYDCITVLQREFDLIKVLRKQRRLLK